MLAFGGDETVTPRQGTTRRAPPTKESSVSVVALISAQEYFKDLLGGALARQKLELGEGTEFYLVNLLSEFLSADKLFSPQDDGSKEQEPLALMLARALDGPREAQVPALRKLGDVSLYVSGFWSDSLSRSAVDVDYYIRMGGAAYGKVAELTPAKGARPLYGELSARFNALVDVLSEVAEHTAMVTNTGVVRLYERWVKTGSARLARLLGQQGVVAQLPAGPELKQ